MFAFSVSRWEHAYRLWVVRPPNSSIDHWTIYKFRSCCCCCFCFMVTQLSYKSFSLNFDIIFLKCIVFAYILERFVCRSLTVLSSLVVIIVDYAANNNVECVYEHNCNVGDYDLDHLHALRNDLIAKVNI